RQVTGELPAGADHYLGGINLGKTVLGRELFSQRTSQFGDARGGSVFGLSVAQRLDRRLFDELGSVEIGLAGSKPADVLARGLESFGLGIDCKGRGRSNVFRPNRQNFSI